MKCQRVNVPIATDNNTLKEGKVFEENVLSFSLATMNLVLLSPARLQKSFWLGQRGKVLTGALRENLSRFHSPLFRKRVNLKFAEACKRRSLVMRAGEMDMRAKQFSQWKSIMEPLAMLLALFRMLVLAK